jgi:hypothetical protein
VDRYNKEDIEEIAQRAAAHVTAGIRRTIWSVVLAAGAVALLIWQPPWAWPVLIFIGGAIGINALFLSSLFKDERSNSLSPASVGLQVAVFVWWIVGILALAMWLISGPIPTVIVALALGGCTAAAFAVVTAIAAIAKFVIRMDARAKRNTLWLAFVVGVALFGGSLYLWSINGSGTTSGTVLFWTGAILAFTCGRLLWSGPTEPQQPAQPQQPARPPRRIEPTF